MRFVWEDMILLSTINVILTQLRTAFTTCKSDFGKLSSHKFGDLVMPLLYTLDLIGTAAFAASASASPIAWLVQQIN